ncbi:MAG: response regulator [Pseudomonadota bacterium]
MIVIADPAHHIVVVEDEPDLRSSVAEYLELQGFDVTPAENGAVFDQILAADQRIDLVLLDLRLPGDDGLTILRRLRQSSSIPVIMVTAMGDPIDRVIGLEVGADDYVVKPFEFRELLARIRSVLRRASLAGPLPAENVEVESQPAAKPDTIRIGRARLDLRARRLFDCDGREIPMTAMEFDLLKSFVDNANIVLTRDRLLDLAHNTSWEPYDRSIDIRVARLRKKIEHDPAKPEAIKTIRGMGYMFVPHSG